uniref:WRC domain-containing protein n=1 Tax=Oryza rufipogon TaxID=4529 RepID=A0A0E0NF17_ORYRU
MRIRRAASRLLGSASAAFSAQAEAPPVIATATASELPPPPAPAAADAAAAVDVGLAGPEGPCEQSLSPWDLPCELLDDSTDSQNLQEAPFDKYLVRIPRRASFVLNSELELEDDTMESKDKIWNHDDEEEEVKNQKPAAHSLKKDGAVRKRSRKGNDEPILQEEELDMVMKTEESEDKEATIWFCKKNDGKKWHCRSIVDRPNALCDYHLARSRSSYTPSSENGASATAAATCSSGPTKADAIGKIKAPPAKSSGAKRNSPGGAAASSSKAAAATATAPSSSKASSSSSVSVTVPTSSISQRRKRRKKSTNGSGGDYYFYDLFGPFRGKDRRNHGVVSASEEDHKGLLKAKEKMEYIDVDNLSNNSSITGGGDKENDENYVVGGAGKARAEKRKGKIAVEKMPFPKMVKKRTVKERSLKSLL